MNEHEQFEAALHAFKEEVIAYNAYFGEEADAVVALIDASVDEGKIVFLKDGCCEHNTKGVTLHE